MSQINIRIMSRDLMEHLIRVNGEGRLLANNRIISVNDFNDPFLFTEKHPELLSLKFSDITPKYTKGHDKLTRQLFTEDQARQVIEHVIDLPGSGVSSFLVHCFAGISRSGAIGVWTNKLLGQDEGDLYRKHPYISPNPHVLELLDRVATRDFGLTLEPSIIRRS